MFFVTKREYNNLKEMHAKQFKTIGELQKQLVEARRLAANLGTRNVEYRRVLGEIATTAAKNPNATVRRHIRVAKEALGIN